MSVEKVLVANRGEIAVRIMRSAADLGIATVAVTTSDDTSTHVNHAGESVTLPGRGTSGYLDAEAIVDAARTTGCSLVHPGYGFLSENPDFAQRCLDAGLTFVGPSPHALSLFGDKIAAKALARQVGMPVVTGTEAPTTVDAAQAFMAAIDRPVVIKARSGGGGRGMRVVSDPRLLADAFERCRSEAEAAFGSGELLIEQLVQRAHHVEVQIVGDGTGAVVHLGDRDCTIQRRHQKLVEIAPCPWLHPSLQSALHEVAVRMGHAVSLSGLATVEFLVDLDDDNPAGAAAFIEVNPRLQVEHTITEEVTGLDLVALQFRIALGATLADLGLDSAPTVSGCAIEVRINAERMDSDGSVHLATGTIERLALPAGLGVRVDHAIAAGQRMHPGFDPLIAKVVVRGDDLAHALRRATRALDELQVEGVDTNAGVLRAALAHPDVSTGHASTTWLEHHAADFAAHQQASPPPTEVGPGVVTAPTVGTIVAIDVSPGDELPAGAQLLVIESMKMEHVVVAPSDCIVHSVFAHAGDTVDRGDPLLQVDLRGEADETPTEATTDLDLIRPDLDAVLARHAIGLDPARPEAVERRHGTGHRTARENLDDLVDPGSFVEYGPLTIAAQRRRRELQELIERTPADGLVGGIGRVNGDRFPTDRTQCVVMSYDYMVLAGTQGHHNHIKKDRLFEIAESQRLPVVLFAEGGGGRPGDTDISAVSGLATMAFHLFGRLSGTVPLVGIAAGRCFAGNAALLGCCDVIIATQSATIGMGGPAMIEGGGLGVVAPEDVGPLSMQVPNGVVDIAVSDEAEAVVVAKRYLSYFQGPTSDWECADQRALRHLIPENRLRVYDIRRVIDAMADTDSVLELRPHFGVGVVTALVRIEGRPMGLIANNPAHLGGAIDHDAADKAARFMQLCDSYGLPIVSLCDTPGFMVGPESERAATVRHFSRMFVNGANLDVPIGTVILRKAYGLGAQAMAGGSFKTPLFTVAWPTGELGGMGLEGAVKLAFRRELDAVEDPDERQVLYDEMVARMYERGKAVNAASVFEIDDVIDPADTRRWITTVLTSPQRPAGAPPRRPCIDTW